MIISQTLTVLSFAITAFSFLQTSDLEKVCVVEDLYEDRSGNSLIYSNLGEQGRQIPRSDVKLPAIVIEKSGRFSRLAPYTDISRQTVSMEQAFWIDNIDAERTNPSGCLTKLPDDFSICPLGTFGVRGSSKCQASQ